MRWSEDQVLALAVDQASVRAARTQATAGKWPESGSTPDVVWGLCQGSGATPYQVCVELAEPAFRCSCPSRKFPCKHALGLLLRWSAGELADTVPPDWVEVWLAERAARAARAVKRAESVGTDDETRAEQAARRRAQRTDRVTAGAAELGEWLADQLRHGLARLETDGGQQLHAMAARMVDAQAPGLAAALRRTASLIGSGRDWPSQVLAELALIQLLVTATARLDELPGPLADTVRARLGFTVDTNDVLATGRRVTDRWLVLGRVDHVDEHLTSRRTWLRGKESGRVAVVRGFAPTGRPLDDSLPPGTTLTACLAHYPDGVRAVVAERVDHPRPAIGAPPGDSIDTALAGYATALAADPWCAHWPMLLTQVVPVRQRTGWVLADPAGQALPLDPDADPLALLAVAAGRPLTVAAEWSAAGLRPLSCWDDDRPVQL